MKNNRILLNELITINGVNSYLVNIFLISLNPFCFKIRITDVYCPVPISNAKIPFNLRICLDL